MSDLVQDWLNSVAYSHSQSKATEIQYKSVWKRYSAAIEMTPEEIIADYEGSNDRNVMRKHARLIRSWIGELSQTGLTNTSIKVMVGAIKSFYKYNDLPLGHIPQARNGIVFHNRDIAKEEIVKIMAVNKIREKAFFAVMAQSGLRPHTIKQLKLKNLEEFDKIPCKIDVPKEISKGKYGRHITFIGLDAVKYLKQYLATRKNLTPDSLLFCVHTNPRKPVNVKDMSRAFRLAARKLEESGALKYEIRERKPSEIRLYNLRKFFRKYANQMGFENVNYLMGHVVRGSDEHYKPQDPEFYRELYAKKAMPFLRLDSPTPTETEQLRQQYKEEMEGLQKKLEDRDKKIKKLETTMKKMDTHMSLVLNMLTTPNPEEQKRISDKISELMITGGDMTEEEIRQISEQTKRDLDEANKRYKKTMIKEVVQELVSKDPKIQEKLEKLIKAFIANNPKLFE